MAESQDNESNNDSKIGVVNAEWLHWWSNPEECHRVWELPNCDSRYLSLIPAVGEQWVHIYTPLPNSNDSSVPPPINAVGAAGGTVRKVQCVHVTFHIL